MALLVLILVVLFAPLLITRAGPLAVAIASGAALHAAGLPAMTAIGAGLVLYVGADAVLYTLAERGGAAGRAGVMFATLCGAAALGGFTFLFGNQGGEHTELAVLLGAGGALTGGLLAYRHYRVFA
jgi:hypothetical protein